MLVRHLQLTNFRTYQNVSLDLPAGRLLFLGDNAQGKSNLLEAVYLLASGRSVRAGNDAEMLSWDVEVESQPFARLEMAVQRRAGEVRLETIVVGPATTPGAGATRAGKRFRVNGMGRRAVDFIGQLRAVLFTADDLEIVSGPPSTRRQFLDSALAQLDRAYYTAVRRYARIMQQRNATLRRIREGIAGPDELSLWDDTFSREGAVIIAARQNAVARLAMLAGRSHADLSGEAPETLEIAYEPQLGDEWRGLVPQEATLENTQPIFAAALASHRRRETGAGISLVGPHRDELSIKLNGASASAYGSRAQIRTTALALRLAEAELLRAAEDDPPILLLDDIVSELDERRRASVLAVLAGFDQVWFTATGGSWLPEQFVREAAVFDVASGGVTARV